MSVANDAAPASYRLFANQLMVNVSASQVDIRRAFDVPKIVAHRAQAHTGVIVVALRSAVGA